MSASDNGGPAFPSDPRLDYEGDPRHAFERGMTFRDYAAVHIAAALAGDIENMLDEKNIAHLAYELAQALVYEKALAESGRR